MLPEQKKSNAIYGLEPEIGHIVRHQKHGQLYQLHNLCNYIFCEGLLAA